MNVDTDKIECEACGAHLTFPVQESSVPEEGGFLQSTISYDSMGFICLLSSPSKMINIMKSIKFTLS